MRYREYHADFIFGTGYVVDGVSGLMYNLNLHVTENTELNDNTISVLGSTKDIKVDCTVGNS